MGCSSCAKRILALDPRLLSKAMNSQTKTKFKGKSKKNKNKKNNINAVQVSGALQVPTNILATPMQLFNIQNNPLPIRASDPRPIMGHRIVSVRDFPFILTHKKRKNDQISPNAIVHKRHDEPHKRLDEPKRSMNLTSASMKHQSEFT